MTSRPDRNASTAGWRQSRERGALVAMVIVSPFAVAAVLWSMARSGVAMIEDLAFWTGLLLWISAGVTGAVFGPYRRVWVPSRISVRTAFEMSVLAVLVGGLAAMATMLVVFSLMSEPGDNPLRLALLGGAIGFTVLSIPALLVSLPHSFVWLWWMRRPEVGAREPGGQDG